MTCRVEWNLDSNFKTNNRKYKEKNRKIIVILIDPCREIWVTMIMTKVFTKDLGENSLP